MNIDQLLKRGGNELFLNSNIDVGINDITVGAFGLLNRSVLYRVSNSMPQFPFIITAWKGVIGSQGHEVIVNSRANEETKNRIKQKIYKIIYTDLKYLAVKESIIEFIAREGNAIVRYDSKLRKILVHSRFKYRIKYNEELDITTYSFLDKHHMEVAGLQNLVGGVDVYHIKHPSFQSLPISPSPIDVAQRFIALENNGVTANEKLFKNSFIGTMLFSFNDEMMNHIQAPKDKDGKNWFDRLMEKVRDALAGVSQAFQVGYIPGLQQVHHLDKNNNDTQFFEMIKELTPERIAWAFSMVLSNFGTGGNLTFNNAEMFDSALYNKIGKIMEHQLDSLINEFILPLVGITTNENLYFKYAEAKTEKELALLVELREQFKVRAITINEYREALGREPLDEEPIESQETEETNEDNNNFFFDAVVKSNYQTNSEKILNTNSYTKFYTRTKKAIYSQLTEFVSRIESTNNLNETIKPLETYYSFGTLKQDLLVFAGLAITDIRKDSRTNFSRTKKYFDGEYPSYVLEYFDERTESLLKGNTSFKSVDAETASQISNIIKKNINEGVGNIAQKILEEVDDISMGRAELIAQNEVANAIESTRYMMYSRDKEFTNGGKQWLTSLDERVRPLHTANASQGIIAIKDKFSNGNDRAGQDIRCRCDTIYYSSEEYTELKKD